MPYQLTTGDWDEIGRITDEIMSDYPKNKSAFEYHVRRVLAKAIVAAQEDYDAQVTAEETHLWDFGSHHISQCQIDWCGRNRGQRRDSATEATS